MTLRIGINGFGRIGKAVARILCHREDIDIVGINDLTPQDKLPLSLKYDSVYNRFPSDVSLEDGHLCFGRHRAKLFAEKSPGDIAWASVKVDYVIDATGVFKDKELLMPHLDAGARKVILAVPGKNMDATVVMGVNDEILTGKEQVVSNASCTTNAAAPIARIVHEVANIEHGYLNTIHAYTNGQSLVDFPRKDPRRSRAANVSIIPTTTGAAKAIGNVYKPLAGKLDGMAYRVPIPDGSIADMVFEVSKTTSVAAINDAVREAAEGRCKGIIQYETDPIVSIDIIGNSHSSIYDSLLTQMVGERMVKVAAWYDNEYGYSNRLVDLALKLASLEG